MKGSRVGNPDVEKIYCPCRPTILIASGFTVKCPCSAFIYVQIYVNYSSTEADNNAAFNILYYPTNKYTALTNDIELEYVCQKFQITSLLATCKNSHFTSLLATCKNYRFDMYKIFIKVAVLRLLYCGTFPANLSYLNFHPLEVMSRYRDPRLQVSENYSDCLI